MHERYCFKLKSPYSIPLE